MTLVDGPPVPPGLVFLAIAAVTIAAAFSAWPRCPGSPPVGVALSYYALLLPAMLWLFQYLNGVPALPPKPSRPCSGARDRASRTCATTYRGRRPVRGCCSRRPSP